MFSRLSASLCIAASVKVSHPLFWCEPALCASTVKVAFSKSTPWSAQRVRLPDWGMGTPRSECISLKIFINDGAKSSLGHFGDILSADNIVAISDPVYPVYVDTNVMEGRKENIRFLTCPPEKEFAAQIPDCKADMIYLCSPNNPTGSVLTHSQLTAWVKYAQKNKSVILFDSAYEAYISDPAIETIHGLLERGAKVQAFDPEAMEQAKTCYLSGLENVAYFENKYDSFKLLLDIQNSKTTNDSYWNCNNNYKNCKCPEHSNCGCNNQWTRVIKVFKVNNLDCIA